MIENLRDDDLNKLHLLLSLTCLVVRCSPASVLSLLPASLLLLVSLHLFTAFASQFGD